MADAAPARDVLAWLRAEVAAGHRGRRLGQGYQAVIHQYDTPFGSVVVKRARHSWLLGRLNRAAVRREHLAYECLRSVTGVPRSFGLLAPDALVLEHVEGPSLRQVAGQLREPERFFAALRRTLSDMHAAGVAHGDLKRKDNILVSAADEQPYVIDFGTAWRSPPGASAWRRRIFAWLAQTDDNAWIKLKYRRQFDKISAADRRYYRPLWGERIARWIRVPYQTLTLRELRKRRKNSRNAPP